MSINTTSIGTLYNNRPSKSVDMFEVNSTIQSFDIQSYVDSKLNLSATSVLRYPLDTPKYYLSMDISQYKPRLSPLNIQTGKTEHIIMLPISAEMKDVQDVDYDQRNLGVVAGASVNAGYGLANGQGELMKAPSTEQRTNKVDEAQAQADGQKVKQAGIDMASIGSQAIAALNGVAPNRFQVILLKGPTFKRHSYNWTFSPNSAAEAEQLRKILVLLKNSQAPGIRLGGLIYTFPRVFQLTFVPNPKYIYKHKPAVLEKMLIDYTGSGNPSFSSESPETDNLSAPTTIKVNMTFLELEFWLSGDYDDTNSGSGSIKRQFSVSPSAPASTPGPLVPNEDQIIGNG